MLKGIVKLKMKVSFLSDILSSVECKLRNFEESWWPLYAIFPAF